MALRRQVKNVVKNFSDIEVKVREATSNDPWGPSSSLTSEIADATYNVQDFSETMTLLWKRINDHGKNWRHVYKSLVVLDYIIKTGSDRVAQQCRENIFAIKTLKDFQFIDKDGKDQGVNVREKSKQLVALLKDEERLKSERQRALKAKERFYQAEGGIGNLSYPKNKKFQSGSKYTEKMGSVDDSSIPSREWPEIDQSADSRSTDGRIDSEIEKVRPSNEAEEEMQLQIALAMSREEAEGSESSSSSNKPYRPPLSLQNISQPPQQATLLNLNDPTPPPMNMTDKIFDPWSKPQPVEHAHNSSGQASNDPWGPSVESSSSIGYPQHDAFGSSNVSLSDPWSAPAKPTDPWGAPVEQTSAPLVQTNQLSELTITQTTNDPWGIASVDSAPVKDPFAPESQSLNLLDNNISTFPTTSTTNDIDLFNSSSPAQNNEEPKAQVSVASSFLANGAHLVDVDNILSRTGPNPASNPFKLSQANSDSGTNPFLQDKPKAKSINEMRNDKTTAFDNMQQGFGNNDILMPMPLKPADNNTYNNGQLPSHNPFLS